jgi:hypothetical protein
VLGKRADLDYHARMADPPPYWLLIAVLLASRPLEPALATRLYQAALELHRQQTPSTRLSGDLASGEVRRLGRSLALGSVSGPAFEAELETHSGPLRVQFLLTRQGLEGLDDDAPPPPAAAHSLN